MRCGEIPLVAIEGHSVGDDGGAREDVRSRHRAWEESEESRSFECVQLREEGAWDWIGQRAVSVMSFLARASVCGRARSLVP